MVDIVDVSLHTSTFPATYVGKGTLIGNPIQGGNSEQDLDLNLTATGNIISIPVGFAPMLVRIIDVTGVIVWQWKYGMPATNTLKQVASGALTIDTTSAIVVTPTPTPQMSNSNGVCTITIAAATAVAGHQLLIEIEG